MFVPNVAPPTGSYFKLFCASLDPYGDLNILEDDWVTSNFEEIFGSVSR